MTVDMLAAASIWPEEMLVGRAGIPEREVKLAGAGVVPSAPAIEPTSFWAAVVRRLRQDRTRTGTDVR